MYSIPTSEVSPLKAGSSRLLLKFEVEQAESIDLDNSSYRNDIIVVVRRER
jgi:hypothetical protein